MKTPTAMLESTASAMHGARWRFPIARDLGVTDETIRRWMSGYTPLPRDHEAFAKLEQIIVGRINRLSAALLELDRWRTG